LFISDSDKCLYVYYHLLLECVPGLCRYIKYG